MYLSVPIECEGDNVAHDLNCWFRPIIAAKDMNKIFLSFWIKDILVLENVEVLVFQEKNDYVLSI
jgi:hypothetical protein